MEQLVRRERLEPLELLEPLERQERADRWDSQEPQVVLEHRCQAPLEPPERRALQELAVRQELPELPERLA